MPVIKLDQSWFIYSKYLGYFAIGDDEDEDSQLIVEAAMMAVQRRLT